jgi:hypothetical protein
MVGLLCYAWGRVGRGSCRVRWMVMLGGERGFGRAAA